MRLDPLPRTVRQKASLAFILVVLLAIGNVSIVQFLLRESDGMAATLNVAGKMRMLSQRIGLEALAGHQPPGAPAPAADLPAAFEAAHDALRHGGHAFDLDVPPVPAALAPQLQAVHEAWTRYRDAVGALAEARAEAGNGTGAGTRAENGAEAVNGAAAGAGTATGAAVADLMRAGSALLARTEALMDGLVAQVRVVQQRALYGAYALFALDLLLLGLAGWVVSRQILRPIHALVRQCRALAVGDYAARSALPPGDELGELGRALNDSAAHIGQLLRDIEKEHAALAEAQAMFRGLSDNTLAGIYMMDTDLRFIYANARMADILGYPQAELADGFPLDRVFIGPSYEATLRRVRDRFAGSEARTRLECTARRRDGSVVELETFGSLMSLHGRPALIGIMFDITERKRAEASARRAALVYAHTSEAMVVTDADGAIQDVNPAFTAVTGYTLQDVVGRTMNVLSSGRHGDEFYRAMWARLHETGRWSGDIHNRRKSGEEYVERLSINTSYNEDGSVNCRIGLFSDVTEKRRREASIWHQAHYDLLTQLPNRQMFQENLRRSIEHSRESGVPFALVFLDLDFFKDVNDSMGHEAGDQLLRLVARRLNECVRSSDLVARLGGDEFTLIIRDIHDPDDIFALADKILGALSQPFTLGDHVVQISASMGAAFHPRDGDGDAELLRAADLAMYAAKEEGRNHFRVYAPEMRAPALARDGLQSGGLQSG
ncbi:diguanylate cyclase domain-containing protein [Castellaniella defragrans]|uniref:diguanylate cyclase domain-containing protein n=1 Tax=Castellaniella defragrans TaxID=75697 RepID=UPI002AFF42CB|nr:diguanylate cyclase [Castellaniella defragrans]